MWRSLKNFFYSLWTYSDLSPDLHLRRQVNQSLHHRPYLSVMEWYQICWQPLQVNHSLSNFIYVHMQTYSGLIFGRVRPGDRLQEDLHLSLICWFDWELAFCKDFNRYFDVDLTNDFDLGSFNTIQELMLFLNQQLLLTNRS